MNKHIGRFLLISILLLGLLAFEQPTFASSTISTTSFSYTDSSRFVVTSMENTPQGNADGHNYRFATVGTEIRFTATGTDLNALVYAQNNSAPFTVTVDGGATTTPTAPAQNSFVTLPIFSGLQDTTHTVVIKYNNPFALDTDNTFASSLFQVGARGGRWMSNFPVFQ